MGASPASNIILKLARQAVRLQDASRHLPPFLRDLRGHEMDILPPTSPLWTLGSSPGRLAEIVVLSLRRQELPSL